MITRIFNRNNLFQKKILITSNVKSIFFNQSKLPLVTHCNINLEETNKRTYYYPNKVFLWSAFSTATRKPSDIKFLLNQVEVKANNKRKKKSHDNIDSKIINTNRLKLKQRYVKKKDNITEEGKSIKTRRQLRNGRIIHEIITEMFAFGKIKLSKKIRDSRIIEITDVQVSRDNKTATVSWGFDEIFLQSEHFNKHYNNNIKQMFTPRTASSPTEKEIKIVSELLKKAMPQIRWHITKVMKGRRAPSLWFVYDTSLDIDGENFAVFKRMKEIEERRIKSYDS